MPNWCYNSATICHEDKEKIDMIEKVFKKEDGDWFSAIHPQPDEVQDWYEWNTENWGTKWSPSYDSTKYERIDDNEIKINFETAWCHPIKLYEKMEEQGFEITAMYQEESNQFIGCFNNGEDDMYEYDITDLASIQELPEALIEFGDLLQKYRDVKEDF